MSAIPVLERKSTPVKFRSTVLEPCAVAAAYASLRARSAVESICGGRSTTAVPSRERTAAVTSGVVAIAIPLRPIQFHHELDRVVHVRRVDAHIVDHVLDEEETPP